MKSKLTQTTVIALLIMVSLSLAGCGGDQAVEPSITSSSSSDRLDKIWLESAPEEVVAVASARQLSPGEPVAVAGVIGGVMHPFTEGFASFVVGDDAIVFCNEMGEDDHCSTPWDACCEDPALLASRRALVQVLDADGMPLEVELRGQQGLKELSEVVVVGTVAAESTEENLIINATGIHVKG